MTAIICQPKIGRTDDEIMSTRERIRKRLEAAGLTVSGPVNLDPWYRRRILTDRGCKNHLLYDLSKDLQYMSFSDACYFAAGWKDDKNCEIMHEAAKAYGLVLLYEDQEEREEDYD